MILDHVQRALDNLEAQFEHSPNLRAIVRAGAIEVQAIEGIFYSLMVDRHLDTATGLVLDQYGRVVGAQRNGLSDSVYLRVIRAKIRVNISAGTVEDLLGIYYELTKDETAQVIEQPPDTLFFTTTTAGLLPDTIIQTLKKYLTLAKKAGVRVYLIQAPVDYFGFYDDPNALGFSTGRFAGVV